MAAKDELRFIPATEAAEISRNLEIARQLEREEKDRRDYENAIYSFNQKVKQNVGGFYLTLYGHIWTTKKVSEFENLIQRSGYDAKCRMPEHVHDEWPECNVNWKYDIMDNSSK